MRTFSGPQAVSEKLGHEVGLSGDRPESLQTPDTVRSDRVEGNLRSKFVRGFSGAFSFSHYVRGLFRIYTSVNFVLRFCLDLNFPYLLEGENCCSNQEYQKILSSKQLQPQLNIYRGLIMARFLISAGQCDSDFLDRLIYLVIKRRS